MPRVAPPSDVCEVCSCLFLSWSPVLGSVAESEGAHHLNCCLHSTLHGITRTMLTSRSRCPEEDLKHPTRPPARCILVHMATKIAALEMLHAQTVRLILVDSVEFELFHSLRERVCMHDFSDTAVRISPEPASCSFVSFEQVASSAQDQTLISAQSLQLKTHMITLA